MRQKDMEWFSFLFLCGDRDRALITGKEEMKFSDFDRLSYITEFLGLTGLNMEIWKRFSPQFQERLGDFAQLIEQEEDDYELQEYDDARIYEEWLAGFCADAPEGEAKRYLRRVTGIETEEERKITEQAEEL